MSRFLLALLSALLGQGDASAQAPEQAWRFEATLAGNPIGHSHATSMTRSMARPPTKTSRWSAITASA